MKWIILIILSFAMSISFFVLFKGFPNVYYILSSTTISTLILLKVKSWQNQNK